MCKYCKTPLDAWIHSHCVDAADWMRGVHICSGEKPSKQAVRKALTRFIIQALQTEIGAYPNERSAVIEYAMKNAAMLFSKRAFRFGKFLVVSQYLPSRVKAMGRVSWLHFFGCLVVVARDAVMSEVYADLERIYR